MLWLSSRQHAVLLMAVFLAVPLLSCIETESVFCPSGRICAPGYRCAATQDICINTPCGDGILQDGEECDDGNTITGDKCNNKCQNETCGNNFKEPHETCDDGNTRSGDGCNEDCRSEEECGNAYIDVAKGEVCDDGNTVSGDNCSEDCLSNEECGNGITDVAKGEVCDNGNTQSGDGCSADCRSDETCGNGQVDLVKYEVCDDGNNENNDECSADCRIAGTGCGNGLLEPGEECDDGDALDKNECLTNCKWARCGDGVTASEVTNVSLREYCDASGESATCNLNCTLARCGDRLVNVSAGEECDKGEQNTSTCIGPNNGDQSCKFSRCGDGYINEAAGEDCDDANADRCGACSGSCKTIQGPAKAKGKIIVFWGFNLEPGEYFILNDGLRPPLTFEFTSQTDKVDKPDRKFIYIRSDADDMAQDIATKITDQDHLDITATYRAPTSPNEGHTVSLEHNHPTSLGNQHILKWVVSSAFKVEKMSGGLAGDCGCGTGCTTDNDCRPGLTCSFADPNDDTGICSSSDPDVCPSDPTTP